MGPIEALIVLVIVVLPLFIVLYTAARESPVSGEPTPQDARLLARLWWLYVQGFRNYWVIGGRTSIREFWTFTLVNAVIGGALSGLDVLLGLASTYDDLGILYGVFAVATLIPGITVTVRRLHDGNRSGWWILIALVPVLGLIVSFAQLVGRGTPGANRFGPDPRAPLGGVIVPSAVDGSA